MRIGIIAGEMSGDILGAGLIHQLRLHYPHAKIEGIGGPQMIAAGFDSLYPLETLSVMGLIEVIKHYSSLKKCRDNLKNHFINNPPEVFIGIDAPDFNLGLEQKLKQAGIPTVHYVSPSVWAWREYRLPKIAQACDLMLTLFPFEENYYKKHDIPVKFVGHSLADEIPLQIDQNMARIKLGLPTTGIKIALLPGSRYNEVSKLVKPFLSTARWLWKQRPDLHFIVPLANTNIRKLFLQHIDIASNLPLTLLDGQAHDAMAAADVVLMASGTASLEAMLLKRPMVVSYRLARITYWLAKLLVRVNYFSLPNLLAQEKLIPEFLQDQVTPENLGIAVLHWLDNPDQVKILQQKFLELHQILRCNASQQAATAILSIIED
ncbi:lipid-A-disaccharide synthase [Candidatus Halobeggiatoa sp. HSG11]|nr:lipid-A-disaccharide synthase [Candidatus Halobeggiatoa sp. HSG11]